MEGLVEGRAQLREKFPAKRECSAPRAGLQRSSSPFVSL